MPADAGTSGSTGGGQSGQNIPSRPVAAPDSGPEGDSDAVRHAADAIPPNRRQQHTALLCLYGVLTLLAIWIVHSFLPAVLWAGVFAIALWPALRRVERWHGLAGRPKLVAALAVVLVAVVFVLPLIVAGASLGGDAHAMFQQVHEIQQNGLPPPDWLPRLPFGAQASTWWQNNLSSQQPGKTLLSHVGHGSLMTYGSTVGKHVVHAGVTFAFMLLVLFFIFAAGTPLRDHMLNGIKRAFGAEGAALATQMAISVRGTVSGLVLVGLGEGALLGVAYFFTHVPHAIVLAALTALAAMLPFCAPVLIAGVAVYLLTTGSTVGAAIVAIWGVIVVFAAEHAVRPALIGGAARLPFVLVLLGILGGAETLGLLGLFIGPALMTILMVLWRDYVQKP